MNLQICLVPRLKASNILRVSNQISPAPPLRQPCKATPLKHMMSLLALAIDLPSLVADSALSALAECVQVAWRYYNWRE